MMDDEKYIQEYELMQYNSKIGEIVNSICDLTNKLRSLDYKTIKYVQGKLSEEEWVQNIEECESLRSQIRSLESQLIEYGIEC